MTPPPRGPAPDQEELNALLRLIDDDTPEVRRQVAARLAAYGGDISESLAAQPLRLGASEREVLSQILAKQRRQAIEHEWLVPSGGAAALREDWELFESLLRSLSDFLHDGITCRQPLSDALDLLADDAEAGLVQDAASLARMLFDHGPLRGNHEAYDDPRNSDLAWCIAEGKSNPIGLCTIYLLVARRLDLPVEAVNFPGHFLCRIHINGTPMLVDCFNRAQLHPQADVLETPELSRAARHAIKLAADPGSIIIRILNNLNAAMLRAKCMDDAALVRKLRESLA